MKTITITATDSDTESILRLLTEAEEEGELSEPFTTVVNDTDNARD